ncbi:3-oxoacyl-ACP synthase [Larkinella soli]|uniref:3-oxoacyl-ACP synthase n=1 Tax=Larkinella soli TaxID=1770527 RepID=UPI000FFC48F9|nr:3-oxoacyl-ACP synthase [Larkinella soli]
MSTFQDTKEQLYARCLDVVRQRIDTARAAMEAAQAAANEESKSSAGDKYETGRAMAQIERDQHARQLAEALRLQQELARIDIGKPTPAVQPGSVVLTDQGNYFIAVGAGRITLGQTDYFAVSAASPVGTVLSNRRAGDRVLLHQKPILIRDVF